MSTDQANCIQIVKILSSIKQAKFFNLIQNHAKRNENVEWNTKGNQNTFNIQ